MGCVHFRKPCALEQYMIFSVSAYGSMKGKNKSNNIFNIFYQ